MADGNNIENVFGGVEFDQNDGFVNVSEEACATENKVFQPVEEKKAIVKQGFWSKVKAFLFQEIDLNAPIKVELTPYQQKVEDQINEFLHQEISFKGFFDILKK